MTRSRTLPLLAVIAALALTSAAPPHQLAPCLHGRFKDITQTLPDGTVVGEPDPHDWGCVGGGSTSDAVLAGPNRRAGPGALGVPGGPPPAVCMDPAAPNPAESGTRLQFALPTPARVSLSIYRQGGRGHGGPHAASGLEDPMAPNAAPGQLVRTLLDAQLMAGFYAIYWDLTDGAGDPLDPGLYRAVLVVGDQALCGDIEVR